MQKHNGEDITLPCHRPPDGWSDDGHALRSLDCKGDVIGRFREFILTHHSWNPMNYSLGSVYETSPASLHRPDLGSGQRQLFLCGCLFWTPRLGQVVYEPFLGLELDAAYEEIEKLKERLKKLEA